MGGAVRAVCIDDDGGTGWCGWLWFGCRKSTTTGVPVLQAGRERGQGGIL